jgi:hypothetical protein
MERPMKTFITKIRGMPSFLSARIFRRVATCLGVLLIAIAVLAATVVGRHSPAAPTYVGGNLMLRPGVLGLAPELY